MVLSLDSFRTAVLAFGASTGLLRHLRYLAPALLSSAMSQGCIAESGDARERDPIGAARASLTGRWVFAWGTTNGPDLDTGLSTATTTCFLSGVGGNLNEGDAPSSATYDAERSEARVYEGTGGHWWVKAQGGVLHSISGPQPVNNPVFAHVTCINSVVNRTAETTQYWNDAATNLGAVTSKRQCFLTGLFGVEGSWTNDSDKVRVSNDGSSWSISSSFSGSSYHSAGGRGRCVDMPSDTWVGTGEWHASDPGTYTVNIGWDSAMMGCALTGVKGHFKTNDWYDGALIDWPSAFPGWWTMTLENGKKAWVTCVQ
jgi:hypothetical protein